MAATNVPINTPTTGTTIPIAVWQDASNFEHQKVILETRTGTADPVEVGATNPMPVTIASGGIPASTDAAGFTAGTTQGIPTLSVYNDALTALTAGTMAVLRSTLNRQLQVALGASQTDGWTPFTLVAPATAAPAQVKASGGKIGILDVTNTTAGWLFLKIWDAVSVTFGTTVPNWNIGIPPGGGNNPNMVGGLQFVNGIVIAVTAGIAPTDTSNPAANSVLVNLGYQ
jgi:hypothetical protein